MHTVNLLIRLVEHHQILTYVVIYLGLIFEGEIFVISTGILAHLGALSFWTSLVFILLGSLSKTFIGYAFGEFLYKNSITIMSLSICKKGYMVFCLDLKKSPFGPFLFRSL